MGLGRLISYVRMGLGRLVEAWSKYGIQILVLLSLMLQLILFILPILRRHKMLEKRKYQARLFKLLLWLTYQLADTTAIYVLGHMAISSSSSHLSGEVMALWASLLLVHLGGQDTMTAYSLEDNRLWKRHLLTLLVQTAGVLCVLFGYEGGGRSSGPYPRLLAATALMFVVGFLKFAERIWVLRSSDMNKLLRRQEERERVYTAPSGQDSSECAEEDLKQAHGMLYFCVCQFVDSKLGGLTPYQAGVVKRYATQKRLFGLVHLQLSLMHDLLYTKAAAIHTWCGFLLRVFSWLATATTFTLVFLSGSSYGGKRLDAAVTYTLLAGAFLLETASSLKAVGSTWTCQILRSGGWCGLGRVVLAFRRLVRAAEWSRSRCPGYHRATRSWRSAYASKDPNTSLFVDEMQEMVTAYIKTMDRVVDHRAEEMEFDTEMYRFLHPKEREKEMENLMNSRGGLSLRLLSGRDEGKVKLTQDLEQLAFDEYLVLWFYATQTFTKALEVISLESRSKSLPSSLRLGAVVDLAFYMMYLFEEQPHMLPPPVRQKTCPNLEPRERDDDIVYRNLEIELLELGDDTQKERKLKAILWVWIEMLCYAASHCNRESHARQLSNGSPEFATVLWVVRATLLEVNMNPPVEIDIDTPDPSSVPPVLDTDLIGNHRGVASV